MLSYAIDASLTKKLKALQSAVSLKFAELRALSRGELDAIHRYARISNIGASTRIENAQLTDPEIDWMDTVLSTSGKTTAFREQKMSIEVKLSKDRERSIEEVAGCRAMLAIVYEQAQEMLPLGEIHIRALHDELLKEFGRANHYRGQYKKSPNSVIEVNHRNGKQRDVFRTADPGPITNAAMADLVKWYNDALKEEAWPVAVAAEFVFRFLAIHPFQDGNGRLGRGLFLLALMQSPDPHLAFISRYLAIDREIERHREDYYLVLNRCSDGKFKSDPKKYKIQHFLNFMIKMLNESLSDIEIFRKKYEAYQGLSDSALKVLQCFQEMPERRLKSGEIEKMSKLPNRTVFYAIQILVKNNFLQRYGRGSAVKYQIVF
jgi:Fic family protein